ncbi:chaoptin-like [Chironomus tepperi]|uniref:chaoptin-like n=1 Tax=Chironomus tepperi TaxID=113505 RepID=UPI00391F677F
MKLQFLLLLSSCVTLCLTNVIKVPKTTREDPQISCRYQPPTGLSGYTCILDIQNPNGHNDFTSIGGEHLDGFTNLDVERLYITFQNTSNIPSIICLQFPNLLDFIIGSSHVRDLDDTSFAGCGRLEFLLVSGNQVQNLPQNVFAQNSNLEVAILDDNRIEQISNNVFAGTRVSYVDLGKNRLTFFNPSWFSGVEGTLEVLLIDYNNIVGFSSYVFDALVNLRELDISVNPDTVIYSQAFYGLTNLRRLYLNALELTTVNPEWFSPLTAIENIHLAYNQIRDIPDNTFDGLSTLQTLDLSMNDLAFLRSTIFGSSIANIRFLHLSYNRLVALDQQLLNNAESLMWLLLLGNDCLSRNYYNVPEERDAMTEELQQCFTNFIGSARCLYFGMLWFPYECVLYINNPVGHDFEVIDGDHLPGFVDSDVLVVEAIYQNTRNIPAVICRQFPNLEDIYMEENQIEVIEAETFAACGNLWRVILSFNRITRVPDQLFSNSPLMTIFEAHVNQIQQIGTNAFAGTQIRTIGLTDNQISDFNPHIFDPIAGTLQELYINLNLLTSLPPGAFNRLNNLVELDLSSNNFRDIPADAFRYLTRLDSLILNNCSIETLNPEWFASLNALTELRIDNNHIHNIPDNIFTDIQQLSVFSMAGNQIRNIHGTSFGNLSSLIYFLAQDNRVRAFDSQIFDQSPNLRVLNMDGNLCADANYNSVYYNRDLVRTEMSNCFRMFDGFIECAYYDGYFYYCSMTIQNVQGRNDFMEITGNHYEDLSNNDVRMVDAEVQDTRNIPSIICRQFPNMDELFIQDSHVQVINEQSFEECRNLGFLNLNGNEITTVPDFTFVNNPNIFTMELYNNLISTIEPNAFAGLEMELLDLEKNLLTSIDGRWFEPSKEYLTYIYMPANRLQDIPEDAFASLNNLMSLDLGINPGINLPSGVFQPLRGSLQRLFLDECDISEINPLWFEGLQELRLLMLNENQIDNLQPGVFDNLPNLFTIDVGLNRLTMVHSDSFGSTLSVLTNYYNDGNPTTSIDPDFFDRAVNLNYLLVRNNECINRNFYGILMNRENVRVELADCFDGFSIRDPLRCVLSLGPDDTFECLMTAHNPSGHDDYEWILQPDGNLNADVGLVQATGQNSRIIPRIICDQYPNLHFMSFINSRVQRLTPGAFENCQNLDTIRLDYNLITTVPSGIFNNNPRLREVVFMANRIHTIADNAFTGSVLATLYLGSNRLTTINRNMLNGIEGTLETLRLYLNNLRDLPENSFDGLQNLQLLDLGINTQISLPANIFQSLRNLRILYLDSAGIEAVHPNWFTALESLTELDIYRNNIRVLPDNVFANMTSLLTLLINLNPIETLSSNIFGDNIRNVQFINAVGCRISAIDERLIDDSDNLDILYLYDNVCTSSNFYNVFNHRDEVKERLQHCFGNFRGSIDCHYSRNALQEYQCMMLINNIAGHNQFTEIPGEHEANANDNDVLAVQTIYQRTRNIPSIICDQFTNLIEIFIEDSEIEWITVSNCPNLQILTLAYNRISSIEAGTFANNPRLQFIDLHSNRIATIADDAFAGTVLSSLYLGLNPLRTFNPAWTSSISETLKDLRLYDSQLTSVPESAFSSLSALEYLDIGLNLNIRIPANAFSNLVNLQSLFIDFNGLRTIHPEWFANLPALRDLHLNSNNLRALPAGSFNNLNITYFSVRGNRLAEINSNSFGDSLHTISSFYAIDNEINAIDREFFDQALSLELLYLLHNVCVDHNFREVVGNRGFVIEELRQCFDNFGSS